MDFIRTAVQCFDYIYDAAIDIYDRKRRVRTTLLVRIGVRCLVRVVWWVVNALSQKGELYRDSIVVEFLSFFLSRRRGVTLTFFEKILTYIELNNLFF